MSKFNFDYEREKIEKKYDCEVCVLEYFRFGKGRIILYRIINKEEERRIPLPIEMQKELNILFKREYRSWLAWFIESVRLKRGFRPKWFSFSISLEGLTVEEANQRQVSWNVYANAYNGCD